MIPVIFKFPLIWFPSVFRLLSSRHFTNILKLILLQCKHRMFLEHWNRQKILSNIRQRFSCLLDEWIAKISKKKIFSRWLFEIIHIIRFEIWDLRSRDLKIFLGYDINYLSIWPFMGHPWFPTRKASKLTFACFQLAGWWPCDCFQLAGWCHSPASWKQTNISFEAFLVGNQGWRIKGQMLR